MQTFQLGLSVKEVNALFPEHFTEDTVISILESAGKDVIASARLRKKWKE